MKKLLRLGICLMVMVLTLVPTFVQAFNSAAHIYIAERVLSYCSKKIDLHYGSIAPDFSLFVPWVTAYEDTHGTDLRLYASRWSPTQQAFAKGWWTHIVADPYSDQYILDKTVDFWEYLESLGITPESLGITEGDAGVLAHYAIEKAMDVLLKDQIPGLACKLLNAALLRSWEDRFLLVKVFVWKEREIDWLTLVETELAFRNLECRYAVALAFSSSTNVTPLAELGEQLASDMFDIEISAAVFEQILDAAIFLCWDDYYDEAIKLAIDAF